MLRINKAKFCRFYNLLNSSIQFPLLVESLTVSILSLLTQAQVPGQMLVTLGFMCPRAGYMQRCRKKAFHQEAPSPFLGELLQTNTICSTEPLRSYLMNLGPPMCQGSVKDLEFPLLKYIWLIALASREVHFPVG